MHRRKIAVFVSTLAIVWSTSQGLAQNDQLASSGTQNAQPDEQTVQPRISFNFKDAPLDQVLDFFSRETGLSIIFQTPAPKGVMTFISPRDYDLAEAITILNLNLQLQNARLTKEDTYLYLRTIDEAARQPEASSQGFTPDSFVTLYLPLDNANAKDVAEQIKPLISKYGKVLSLPAQNLLILVETATQSQRLRQIISAIDAVRPADAGTQIFPITNAKASDLVTTLRLLVPEREKTTIIDKQGKPQVIDDMTKPPLILQPDARSNSIIAVGSPAKLSQVQQLVTIMDSPEGVLTGRKLITFTLTHASTSDIQRQLTSLFSGLEPRAQPRILPLADVSKIAILGTPDQIIQASSLISEIDPPSGDPADSANTHRQTVRLPLKYIKPQSIQPLVSRLLTPRQNQVLRYATSPDQQSIIVTGPSADVDSFTKLVSSLDNEPQQDREIRLVHVASQDPQAALNRALELYELVREQDTSPLSTSLDASSSTLTLVATREVLDRFTTILRSVQDTQTVQRETRTYEIKSSKPSKVASKITRLARSLLKPDDGSPYAEPRIEPLDELDQLIVHATPSQFSVIEELITKLDEPEPGTDQFRIVPVTTGNPQELANRTLELYNQQIQGLDETIAGPIAVQVDQASGSLLLKGSAGGISRYTALLNQMQQLVPPTRNTQLTEIRFAKAQDVATSLKELLAGADSIEPSRKAPEPTIQVIDRLNSLLVTAEPAQHKIISDFIRRLDQLEPTDLPPLKLLQVRTADAVAIASMLSAQYGKRAQTDRVSRPVDVRADTATNTLIVSAHAELFDEIKAFVEEINRDQDEGPTRETVLFPLKVAKAVDVAKAMSTLYPQPPMPRDRRGNPMPWLQKPREVTVSADPSSNSLIIDAPSERIVSIKALAEKLDRVELPPVADIRTYHIVGAEINSVSRTLTALARQGMLSGPVQPGKQPVKVLVEAEPLSSTLIVAGDDVTFSRVEKMLEDLIAVPVERQLRIVPIANADAATVKDRALLIYNTQIESIPDASPVNVTINDSTNSLEVVADSQAMSRFMRVLDELQRQTGPARDLRMIELRYAKADQVISFLQDMVSTTQSLTLRNGPEPVFEAIEATNSLMIAAQPDQFVIIEQLVRSLDNQQSADRPPLRILRLRTTDAANLASILQKSYQARSVEQRAKLPVDVQADIATNTLVISAHPDVFPEIESIVNQLNETQSLDDNDREIRIFPLKFARAEELAKTIDEMFPEPPMPFERDRRGNSRPRPDLRQPKEVFVRADPGTNSLIVDAPSKRLAGFEQIVSSLDKQNPAENVELRTYRVLQADLNAVAKTLKDLSSRGALGGPSGSPISINIEPKTRLLIVSGPGEIFNAVERVLSELETAQDRPSTTMSIYHLKHARAERLQPLLEQLLITRARDTIAEDGAVIVNYESLIDVAADVASNTLIISAPVELQQLAEQLVKSLDTENAAIGKAIIRVLPLSYAEASQVASALNSVLPRIELPTGGKVTVLAAAGSNALMLTGAEKDLKIVQSIIEPLDAKPIDGDTPGVETFALENADASTIAKTVERLLIDQQQEDPRLLALRLRYSRGRGDLFKKPRIRVEADSRTNSLIVSGPSATVALAKTVIQRLDQPATQTERIVMTFTPKRADPRNLAQSVQRVANSTMPKGRVPLELVAEPRSASVVVIGTQDQVTQAVRLLGEFDDRTPALPRVEVRVFDITNIDAAAVSSTLSPLLNDRSRWPEALVYAERSGLVIPSPRINVDAQANRIIISAAPQLLSLAHELVSALDQPQATGVVELRVFALREGDANSVATALRTALTQTIKPGDPTPVVTPEPISNTIVVTANADQLEQAQLLVSKMDLTIEPDGVGVKTIYLQHAQALALAPLVQRVLTKADPMEGLPDWAKASLLARMASRGVVKSDQPVRVVAEPRLNALIVGGPVPILSLAEQIIAELDRTASQKQLVRSIKVISLLSADAAELAKNIQAVFEDEETGQLTPRIRVDVASNSLIVRASPEQMLTIDQLAKKIDAAALTGSRQLRMIPVDRSRVDANLMAQTLKSLMEKRSGIKVQIITTDQLLSGPDAQSPEPASDPKAEPLGYISPREQLYETLMTLRIIAVSNQPASLSTEPEDTTSEPAQTIRIAVDPATNSLIVIGSDRLASQIQDMVRALEKEMPRQPTSVHIVSLPQAADARLLKNLIDQTVRQIGRVTVDNPTGFTGRVAVMPDPTGAALVVWANETDFSPLKDLIASLSRLDSTNQLTIKVYPLVNVRADRAVAAINDLVNPRPRGRLARQVRSSMMTLDIQGSEVQARIDPGTVRVTTDPSGSSIIVAAPHESISLIDRFISVIDQSPVADRLAIRRYVLKNADAPVLSRTLQTLMDSQRQGPGARDMPRARFVADSRTNALLVTASQQQHEEVQRLLQTADAETPDDGMELAIIALQNADATTVKRVVEQAIIGNDPAKKDRVQISAEKNSNLFVVRAKPEVLTQIRDIVERVDSTQVAGPPVRTIKLERADAGAVASSLQRFFADRTRNASRSGRRSVSAITITGDRRTGTLVVSASDEDFDQIKSLAASFDAPESSREMQFRIVPLKQARVSDIADTLQNITYELQYERMYSSRRGRQSQQSSEDRFFIETNERTNTVLVMGEGPILDTVLSIIEKLDQPPSDQTIKIVKAIPVENADLDALSRIIQSSFSTPGWRFWRGPDPDGIQVQIDRRRRLLILVGKQPIVEQALGYIAQLDEASGKPNQTIQSIALQYAQADRAARSLTQFFRARARAQGLRGDEVTIIGSRDGNVLIVSADEESLTMVNELVEQIDHPDIGDDRSFAVYELANADARETAQALRAMFPRSQRPEDRILITPRPTTNSLIVSSPADKLDRVKELVDQLDAPPNTDNVQMATIALESARANEVAKALKSALPASIKVTITPLARSNALWVTGSAESIDLVRQRVADLDIKPTQPMISFRRIKLDHAIASELSYTLNRLSRQWPRQPGDPAPSIDYNDSDNTLAISATPAEMDQIEKMIEQLDIQSESPMVTEFVKLKFADSEQIVKALKVFYGPYAFAAQTPGATRVAMVADPSSNSLIISAPQEEWDGIREQLAALDTEEYDVSRQLKILPLKYADAQSLARALNDGFRAPLQDQIKRDQLERQNTKSNRPKDNGSNALPVLVPNEGAPAVSAEIQTNSLLVFASRTDFLRIQEIVTQLDQPEFTNLPTPHVIPLDSGRASTIAAAVREMFRTQSTGRNQGVRSVIVFGDDASNSLIIRAGENDFALIQELVASIQQQEDRSRADVRVLPLINIPAARIAPTLLKAFSPTASQQGQTIAIQIDRDSNSLLITSSKQLFDQIKAVAQTLDDQNDQDEQDPDDQSIIPTPGIGQSVHITELVNNAPQAMKSLLESLGVTRAQPADRPGIVAEPVIIVALTNQRAIAIVASHADGKRLLSLIKTLDTQPINTEQSLSLVPLQIASADGVVATLRKMLQPAQDASGSPAAQALAEQVRRLQLTLQGIASDPVELDLTAPIRLIPDTQINAVIVGSTPANVAAISEIIRTLDTMPIGQAVVVRFFPLDNASSTRIKRILDDLFAKGKVLGKLPGIKRQALPSSATGQALAGEIAISVDDRTNTLIAAGTEEAVTLVEILVNQLDNNETTSWVQPNLIQLKHADASRLADKLNEVLVKGIASSSDSLGLQRQIARLRVLPDGNQGDPIQTDLFTPLTGLIISAEPQLNALIVVGSQANTSAVIALAKMLDVPQASASNTVRVFPLEHAAADRILSIIQGVFDQREKSIDTRPEDRLMAVADSRTNALIVSTSPRSFSILESLLKTLDGPDASFTVNLHIIPIIGADARQIAPLVQRLMKERLAGQKQSGRVRSPNDTFTVAAEPTTNSLIIAASNENFQMIRDLLDTLMGDAQTLSSAERVELIPVSSGTADDIASWINEIYAQKENIRRGPKAVTVLSNNRLNTLIVSGTDADIQAVTKLVERFAKAEVSQIREIRRVELHKSNAGEIRLLLQSVLAGRSLAGARTGSSGQATKLRFYRDKIESQLRDQGYTEAEFDGSIRDQISLTADLRTNSLLINAPPEMMDLINTMIEDIENTEAGERQIKSFKLINADARQMALVLRDLFSLSQQGDRFVLVPTGFAPADPFNPDEPENPLNATLTPVPDQRQELSLTIDARTNSLLVSGTEEYLDLVKQVVEELDAMEGTDRESRVFQLKNAQADLVESTLQRYFSDEAGRVRQMLSPSQAGSLSRQLENEVTIVGDAKSQKLLITASPRYMDTVSQIVEELDAAPSQVLIQVLLAEVTLDTASDWGMDFSIPAFGGVSAGINTLGAGGGIATALGVPNLSVSAADFDLLIRSLEVNGKLEVLSRPQITVHNNELATINVGEDIAIVTGVDRFSQGNSTANVERRDVGILLEVTPSIGADGFVRMSIKPQISTVSTRTTQISEGFESPIINKREIDTTVTVRDGHTIVIGGLIQTTDEQRFTKIPILGDIPLLGEIFKSRQKSEIKTELLVILTPRIIPGGSQDSVKKIQQLTEHAIKELVDPSAIRRSLKTQDLDYKAEPEKDDK